jgi:hypothetical protein
MPFPMSPPIVRFHHAGPLVKLHLPVFIFPALLVIQLENIQLFVGFGQTLALNSGRMDSFLRK